MNTEDVRFSTRGIRSESHTTWMTRTLFIMLCCLSGLGLSCGSGQTRPQATPEKAAVAPGAFLACRLFAPLAKDANDGLLNQTEFRDGLKKIYEQARIEPNSDVTRASSALLLTFTQSANGASEAERDRITRERFLALANACLKL